MAYPLRLVRQPPACRRSSAEIRAPALARRSERSAELRFRSSANEGETVEPPSLDFESQALPAGRSRREGGFATKQRATLLRIWKSAPRRWREDRNGARNSDSTAARTKGKPWSHLHSFSNPRPLLQVEAGVKEVSPHSREPPCCGFGNPRSGAGAKIGTERGTPIPQQRGRRGNRGTTLTPFRTPGPSCRLKQA
jgi:hypothetical protein